MANIKFFHGARERLLDQRIVNLRNIFYRPILEKDIDHLVGRIVGGVDRLTREHKIPGFFQRNAQFPAGLADLPREFGGFAERVEFFERCMGSGGFMGQGHECGIGEKHIDPEHIPHKTLGGGGIADDAFLYIGLQTARMRKAADGERRIAELEERE